MVWEDSLHGIWNFSLGSSNRENKQNYKDVVFNHTIAIPGILQAQGYGENIRENTPWVSSLHDKLWYQREEYKPDGEGIHVPFLSQPPKHYTGTAWYQRKVTIPDNLNGCIFYLEIECVKWKTSLWADSRFIGSETALCTPHRYCLGELEAGEHSITVCVDNSFQYPYRPDGHMVSDALGASWNGMVGKVLIEAVPAVHMENLRVFPELETKKVMVEVMVRNHTGQNQNVLIEVNGISRSVLVKEEMQTVNFETVYPEEANEWDEYSPALHHVSVSLTYKNWCEEKTAAFGFRKIEAKDGLFYVNHRPAYFRGTHFGGDFPLTGYPSVQVSDWKKIMAICKDWGLNYIRFHSFCPPEAAFTAADEAGIYLQVECGMWNDFNEGCSMNEVLWEETKKIMDAFGNHPSFVMLSPSNEPGGDWYKPLADWVEKCRKRDRRHIYTIQSGWPFPVEPGKIEGTDYVYFHRSGYGIQPGGTIRNDKGWHGKDYRLSLEGIKYPVISHELGQWCSYPDFDVIKKFTGYLKPGNYMAFRKSAKKHGVFQQYRQFAYLSGKLKVQLYKEEIEANFRTPHLYGFELLELHDYLGQGTALVGLLDPFWEEKEFITAEEFKTFCSETIPLLRMDKRVYQTGEVLDCPLEICHFGKEEIKNARIYWEIHSRDNKAVKKGEFPSLDLPLKKNIEVGRLQVELSTLQAPAAYEIVIGIHDTGVKNSWSFWLYEGKEKEVLADKVLYTHSLREALEALALGRRVIYAPLPEHHRLQSPPLSVRPSFWNSQMGPTYSRGMGLVIRENHPALELFPTRAYQEWQWEEILSGAYGLNLSEFPKELAPIVQPIDDYNRNYRLGMILECKVLKGFLLIVTADLDMDLENRPAAKQLRQSLFTYAASGKFAPKVRVREEILINSFFPRKIMMDNKVKAAVLKGSFISDYSSILDGNPNTFYTSEPFDYPFTIELESEKEINIKGLIYMPRQNDREHKGDIKGCRVQVYAEGKWRVVYEGELVSSYEPKEIYFSEAVTSKKVRFTALYGFSGEGVTVYTESREGWFTSTVDYEDTTAAIAELLFIPAEDILSYLTDPSEEMSYRENGRREEITEKSATREIEY